MPASPLTLSLSGLLFLGLPGVRGFGFFKLDSLVIPPPHPFPARQSDFPDLLPQNFPFELPALPALDPVAGRLARACGNAQDLAALAVAASELHSMKLTGEGYDLSLPDFTGHLDQGDWSLLQSTCNKLAAAYARTFALMVEESLLNVNSSNGNIAADGVIQLCVGAGEPAGRNLLTFEATAARALARITDIIESSPTSEKVFFADDQSLRTRQMTGLQARAAALANEVRNFLDHAFVTMSFSPIGFAAMGSPFPEVLGQMAPALLHHPFPGQRWDVLRAVLFDLYREVGRPLRVAEVGVEKGMTLTFLMRHCPFIGEYVAVDPWHIEGKPDTFNEHLQRYFRTIALWTTTEPIFQRDGQPAVRVMKENSQTAAGYFEADYFDLVFIDAEHTFQEVQHDIATWKRRVRHDGGIIAGHDFSIFHPAVALAALLECGPGGQDYPRFPLELDPESSRPMLHLAPDSVWWCRRAGKPTD